MKKRKFTDWKAWIFFIFPLLMTLFFAGVFIYSLIAKVLNLPLIISASSLAFVGGFLVAIPNIYERLKKKFYLRGITSIVLAVCALGLFMLAIVRTPELIDLNNESTRLYNEWINSYQEDQSIFQAWRDVRNEELHADLTLALLVLGAVVVQSFMTSCASISKKEKLETSDTDKENS